MLLKLFREKKGSRKKKVLLLMLGTLRGGKGPAIKGKKLFLESFLSNVPTAIKLEGGGGGGLGLNCFPKYRGLLLIYYVVYNLQDVILDLDWFWPNISIPLAFMFLLDAC